MNKKGLKSNIIKRQEKQMRTLINTVLIEQVTHSEITSITITNVDMTNDYDVATVFYDTQTNSTALEEALVSITGLVKKSIATSMDLRKIPNIAFKYDQSLNEARNIKDILNKINKKGK